MTRKLISFVSLLATVLSCAFCMSACDFFGQSSDSEKLKVTATVDDSREDVLAIQVEEISSMSASLMQVMYALQEEGKITFEVQDGMVTKIGDLAQATNSYWMLYTSDEEMSNTEWGTYTYDGEILGSSALGADALTAVAGETYIWVYQTF